MDRSRRIECFDTLALRKQADYGALQRRERQDCAMGASQQLSALDTRLRQGPQVAAGENRAAVQRQPLHRQPGASVPNPFPRI